MTPTGIEPKLYVIIHVINKKLKWSRYRPGVAQRVGRGIALLYHDRSTRRGWVVSSTPRPHFIPGKDPVPILQETGWAPGPVWTGEKSRPHRDSIPDRPARSSVAKGLSYRAYFCLITVFLILSSLEIRTDRRQNYISVEFCFAVVFTFNL